MRQHVWKVFRSVIALPIRISIGYGDYEVMHDGALRGLEIDLAHRILNHCEPSGLVVTNAAREKLADSGFRYKLCKQEAVLKGFGNETFWRSNGTWKAMERRAYVNWINSWGIKNVFPILLALALWTAGTIAGTLALAKWVLR